MLPPPGRTDKWWFVKFMFCRLNFSTEWRRKRSLNVLKEIQRFLVQRQDICILNTGWGRQTGCGRHVFGGCSRAEQAWLRLKGSNLNPALCTRHGAQRRVLPSLTKSYPRSILRVPMSTAAGTFVGNTRYYEPQLGTRQTTHLWQHLHQEQTFACPWVSEHNATMAACIIALYKPVQYG